MSSRCRESASLYIPVAAVATMAAALSILQRARSFLQKSSISILDAGRGRLMTSEPSRSFLFLSTFQRFPLQALAPERTQIDVSSRQIRKRRSFLVRNHRINTPFRFLHDTSTCTSSKSNIASESVLQTLHALVEEVRHQQVGPHSVTALQGRTPSSAVANLRKLATHFSTNYPKLPSVLQTAAAAAAAAEEHCERFAVLRFLALECSVVGANVTAAVHHYQQVTTSADPDLSFSQAVAKLRQTSTATYEHVLQCLLECCAIETLQFALVCRTDIQHVLAWLQRQQHYRHQDNHHHDDDDHTATSSSSSSKEHKELAVQLKQLDALLRQLLATWISPSLLKLERMSYDTTPAAVIERIARNEAVHPLQNLQDLRQRFGPNRRVLALLHPFLPLHPLVVVHVSLQASTETCPTGIPHSMTMVHDPPIPDIQTTPPTVAAFYSISNIESGLAGTGLGEHLLKQTIHYLQKDLPSLDTFVTLSPMPRFRKWLEERVLLQRGSKFAAAAATATATATHVVSNNKNKNIANDEHFSSVLLDAAHLQQLATALKCSQDHALTVFVERLVEEGPGIIVETSAKEHETCILRNCLKRLAAHYIVDEKHRLKPLDPVARFHLSNGASVHRINIAADLSRLGWQNSFGVMVNYLYDLPLVADRQSRYYEQADHPIHVNETVLDLLRGSDPDE